MTIKKTVAVAMLVAAAGLGASMTEANAGGKKHFGHHHHHHHGSKVIILGSPDFGCKHWLRKYKKTGSPFFLKRYYACLY